MFTGIIEGVGRVKKVEAGSNHRRIEIECSFSLKGTKLGDSIAVNGCCLTATQIRGKTFRADVSPETLRLTNIGELKAGSPVNLERPLRLSDRLGGHLVQGHVDGIGRLARKSFVKAEPEGYWLLEVEIPKHLRPYMVDKGSVTVDGISLTVNRIQGGRISLCIIPHTQERTTLVEKDIGAKLNIEADILLKYLEKMIKAQSKGRKKNL